MLKTRDGWEVVDRHRSHLHGGVLDLLPHALSQIDTRGRGFLVETIDFGRVIGGQTSVPTSVGDEVVWAQRPGRVGLTRFVKNRSALPTTNLTVILKRGDREYVVITVWVGGQSEPEPWDRNATVRSRVFWATHALVWGAEETIPGTETSVCPW